MILSLEWNNGAVAIILLAFLIPVIIVFLLLLFLIRLFPKVDAYFDYNKKHKPLVYYLMLLLLFGIAVFLFLAIAGFFKSAS